MSENTPTSPTAPTVPATRPTSSWISWMPRIAGPFFARFMFVMALTALHHLLREHHLRDILASARAIPTGRIGWAALATVLAFVALTGYGALAFLYVRRALAYQWFDLGMAPLSGLESHPLAPVWNRIGNLIFRHGECFFNYQGLREYKGKFEPVLEPR